MRLIRPVVYSYKVFEGRKLPLIPLKIIHNTQWSPNITALVDSGAAYSVFNADTADCIGLDYKKGEKKDFKFGDGKIRPLYLNELLVQIGVYKIKASIGFSDELGLSYSLLGRKSFFEYFKVCFYEKNEIITFEPFSNLNGRTCLKHSSF